MNADRAIKLLRMPPSEEAINVDELITLIESQQKEIANSNSTVEALMSSNCNMNDILRSRGFTKGSTEERLISLAQSHDKQHKEIEELKTKLAFAEDAAAKGDLARLAAGGMEMEIEELKAKYMELIYAVERKFPEETRHQTALRYIQEMENRCLDIPAGQQAIDAAMQETKPK